MRRALIERVVRELASFERPSASRGERRAAEWLARRAARGRVRGPHRGRAGPRWLLVADRPAQRRLPAGLAGRAPGARGAGGRVRHRGRVGRHGGRAAMVPPRGAAPRLDLERGGRDRGPATPGARSCSSPTTTPLTAGSCSIPRCRGSACASRRASTRRPTRASRSCSASSSGRCSRRSAASRGAWGSASRRAPSPPGATAAMADIGARAVVPGANDNLSSVGSIVAARPRPPRAARARRAGDPALHRVRGVVHGGHAGLRAAPLPLPLAGDAPSSCAWSASARPSCAWSRRRGCCSCATTPRRRARRWRGRATMRA